MLLGVTIANINWHLQFGMSGGQFKTPQGLSEDSYVDYQNLKTVVAEVVANHKRLLDLKKKLEENSTGDLVVKVLGGLTCVLGTLMGIFLKIKSVKKSVVRDARDADTPRNQMIIARPSSGVYSSTGF